MAGNPTADLPARMLPGKFHRRVRIACDGMRSSADVEDDQHRFGADIVHDGSTVRSVGGRALRTPWTTCPLAIAELDALIGAPLLPSPYGVSRLIVLAKQCTHLLDMAALAVAAAARGVRHREYDAVLSVSDEGGADWRLGTLQRDGDPCSRWVFRNGIIQEPREYAGLNIRRAAGWAALRSEDADTIESIFVMQHAVLVAGGRRYVLDDIPLATSQTWLTGACFTFQPSRVDDARRRFGSTREFTDSSQLLADLAANSSARGFDGPG